MLLNDAATGDQYGASPRRAGATRGGASARGGGSPPRRRARRGDGQPSAGAHEAGSGASRMTATWRYQIHDAAVGVDLEREVGRFSE